MAHLISNINGANEIVCGRNMTPWHGLGTVVSGLMTAQSALELAHLDWQVITLPVTVGGIQLPFPTEENSKDCWQGICRSDTGACLGVMRGQYQTIQNSEAFNFFDNLIGQGAAVYDTAGALRGGKQVWLLAKLDGSIRINGDEFKQYALMLTSHDGSYALQVQFVTERVVCANTLSIALSGATNTCKVRHTRNWRDGEAEAARVLGLGSHYFKTIQAALDGLNDRLLTPDQMAELSKLLLPAKDEGEKNTRLNNIRSEISTLFQTGQGNHGQTRWDALQAVTDYTAHAMTLRGENSTRLESNLQGAGAALNQRAYEILTNDDLMGNLIARPVKAPVIPLIQPLPETEMAFNPFMALLNR